MASAANKHPVETETGNIREVLTKTDRNELGEFVGMPKRKTRTRDSSGSSDTNSQMSTVNSNPNLKRPSPKPVIESVVFVPYTPGSMLRKHLQSADIEFASLFHQPCLRFVE